MTESRQRALIGAACVAAAVLIFGNKGFRDLFSNWREKRHLEHLLIDLRAENVRLNVEFKKIRDDKDYAEFLVRKNLHYVRKEEVEYRLVPASGKK